MPVTLFAMATTLVVTGFLTLFAWWHLSQAGDAGDRNLMAGQDAAHSSGDVAQTVVTIDWSGRFGQTGTAVEPILNRETLVVITDSQSAKDDH